MRVGQVRQGDAFDLLAELGDATVDAVITDPPYDLTRKRELLTELLRVCTGNIVLFCAPENQMDEEGIVPDEWHFWVKPLSTKNFSRRCGRFVEMIAVYRQGKTFNQLHWSQMVGVHNDKLVMPPVHPFEKPITLLERLVRIYTNPDDLVLDPFTGSGTTAKAATGLGRRFLGFEKDDEWFVLAGETVT